MEDSAKWLGGLAIALSGVALSLWFQGRALEHPEKSQKIGRLMKWSGIWWLILAVLVFIVFIWNS